VSEQHELLQFFVFAPFSEVAVRFCRLTAEERRAEFMDIRKLRERMERELPANSQRGVCAMKLHEAEDAVVELYDLGDVLQLLLEAKDCAVRAKLCKPVEPPP
jgi:phage terminase large subunit-like protein